MGERVIFCKLAILVTRAQDREAKKAVTKPEHTILFSNGCDQRVMLVTAGYFKVWLTNPLTLHELIISSGMLGSRQLFSNGSTGGVHTSTTQNDLHYLTSIWKVENHSNH